MKKWNFISKEPIRRGWSGDEKFCAVTEDGLKYLLRLFAPEKVQKAGACFEMQKQLAALGISMCQPLDFGICETGAWSVQRWISGESAEEALPALPREEQYRYGLEAGRLLKTIHSIPAPAGWPDWEARFNAKIDRKISMYRDCPISFDGADAMMNYIEANRHLLAGRPQCFQHGDYHTGNMMLENGKLVIIDFDRFDFGDPWEEFNRIVWCAQLSPAFASGMVDGYFDNAVPMEFWKLLALYIGSNMLSSIPWAIPFGQGEIDVMLNQAEDVLSWYQNMTDPVPRWYQH